MKEIVEGVTVVDEEVEERTSKLHTQHDVLD